MALQLAAALLSFTPPVPPTPSSSAAIDRRALLAGGLLGAVSTVVSPLAAAAKIESVNPANNYYFPMAKYRYLPRILRAWIAVDQLSGDALAQKDWEGLQVIWERCDDTITAMPLYTSAVEGSRSTKRKKKSDAQKELISQQKVYKEACGKLEAAIKKKDIKTAEKEITSIRGALKIYREVAQIDKEDGGVIQLPESEEYEGAGHAGAPLGYVVPAFRGGGYKVSDYALR